MTLEKEVKYLNKQLENLEDLMYCIEISQNEKDVLKGLKVRISNEIDIINDFNEGDKFSF